VLLFPKILFLVNRTFFLIVEENPEAEDSFSDLALDSSTSEDCVACEDLLPQILQSWSDINAVLTAVVHPFAKCGCTKTFSQILADEETDILLPIHCFNVTFPETLLRFLGA